MLIVFKQYVATGDIRNAFSSPFPHISEHYVWFIMYTVSNFDVQKQFKVEHSSSGLVQNHHSSETTIDLWSDGIPTDLYYNLV